MESHYVFFSFLIQLAVIAIATILLLQRIRFSLSHNTARSYHCCNLIGLELGITGAGSQYRSQLSLLQQSWTILLFLNAMSQYRSQLSLLQQQALKPLAQSGFPSPLWQTKLIFTEVYVKTAYF